MNKKMIVLIMALLVAFSFCACRKRIPDETAKPQLTGFVQK